MAEWWESDKAAPASSQASGGQWWASDRAISGAAATDTAADSAARGLPPLELPVRHTGYAAQARQALAQSGLTPEDQKQTAPQPITTDLVESRLAAAGRGLAKTVGGIGGDIQTTGIPGFVPPAPEGARILPTSTEVGDWLRGRPPADDQELLTEDLAGVAAPLAASKLMKVPSAIARTLMGAAAIPRSASAADKGLLFAQNIARSDSVTPDMIAEAAGSKPVIGAEAMGPRAQTHLMAAARREGTAGPELQALMTERAQGRSDRLLEDMANSSGVHPEAAKGNIDALVEAGQAKAKPLFDTALGGSEPVWNADLARLAERPAIKKAIAGAVEDLKNADINPQTMGLEIDPMMGETGAKQLQPTAKAWDLIRKNLAGTVERDPFGKPIPDSISRGNYNVNQATRDLAGALKSAIPGYGDALNVSGDYLSSRAAFERGQSMILNSGVTEDQFAKAVAKMSPAEQEALKGGVANKLFDLAQNNRLNPKQFLTPRAQAKLETALGPDQARMFVQNLQKEAEMAAFERRAIPAAGSQTAPLSQAMKEQDAFGQNQALNDAQNAVLSGKGPRGIAMDVAGGWLGRKGQALADFIRTQGLGIEGRNEMARLLMLPPDQLAEALRTVPGAGLAPGAVNNLRPGIDPKLAAMLSTQALLRLLGPQAQSQ